jgi:predicted  nucleic acid-binding Zn-ribbon protein
LDLKTADDKILKYKAALMQVKTNDEYRAALNEIDYTNRTRGDLENRVLELMEDVEARRVELKGLEAELKTEDEKIKADRKVLEDERAKLVAARAKEEKAAAAIEANLPDNKVAAYRRISSVRGGIALARVQDGVCQACNMRMRPAIFQQVKRNTQMILCDSCGRILFHVEPQEVEAALPEEAPAVAVSHAAPASRQGE